MPEVLPELEDIEKNTNTLVTESNEKDKKVITLFQQSIFKNVSNTIIGKEDFQNCNKSKEDIKGQT